MRSADVYAGARARQVTPNVDDTLAGSCGRASGELASGVGPRRERRLYALARTSRPPPCGDTNVGGAALPRGSCC